MYHNLAYAKSHIISQWEKNELLKINALGPNG